MNMSITGITANHQMLQSQKSAAAADDSGDVTGKNEFLQLLVTQLQNQDPLNPMDNTEFLSQMAQFSSLEQLIHINTTLEKMSAAQTETTA